MLAEAGFGTGSGRSNQVRRFGCRGRTFVPVHAATHLCGLDDRFFMCLEHRNGVDVLAGCGGAEFEHFGVKMNFLNVCRNVN